MRIEKLIFENINALAGRHELDFTENPLLDSGLFLIAGATGSGKSTILDAVCLALYNKVPRYDKSITKKFVEETGAILTQGKSEAFAQLQYSCKSGRFISRWSIRTKRTGSLDDYHMEVSDEFGKLLTQKRSEAAGQNELHIGLNYDQFVRSIILAQGQFSKFLLSKNDERGKLLESITGTQIYGEIGRKAFEKYSGYAKQIKELDIRIQELSVGLIDAEILDGLKENKAQLIDSLKGQGERRDELNLILEREQSIHKLKSAISSLEDEQKINEEELSEFKKTHQSSIDKHRQLIPYSEDIRRCVELIDSVAQQKEEVERLVTELSTTKANQKELVDKINSKFVKTISLENFKENWSEVKANLSDKFQQLNEISSNYRQLRDDILARCSQSGLSDESSIGSLNKILLLQEKTIKKSLADSGVKNVNRDELIQELTGLRARSSYWQEIQSAQKEYADVKGTYDETVSKLKDLKKSISSLPDAIKIAQLEYKNAQLAHQALMKERDYLLRIAKYEEDRNKLIPEEPCPLCGSVHHPWVEHSEDFTDNEIDKKLEHTVVESKEALARWKVKESEQKNLLQLRETALRDKQKKEGRLSDLMSAIEQCAHVLSIDLKESGDSLKQEEDQRILLLENAAEDLRKLSQITELLRSLDRLDHLEEKGKECKQEIGEYYLADSKKWSETRDHTDEQWAQLTLSENRTLTLKNRITLKLNQDEKEQKQLLTALRPKLLVLDYSDLKGAAAHILNASEYERLSTQQTTLIQKNKSLEEKHTVYTTQLVEMQKGSTDVSIDDLKTELQTVLSTIKTHEQSVEELHHKISTQKDLTNRLDTVSKEKDTIAQDGKIWGLLNSMIGDKTGKKFSTYAQNLTLKHLVVLANERLRILAPRYLIDLPADSEDPSLTIIDRDRGDERRSVMTLSGGETFLVSMALALGLSDLARRDIEMDSLFIDEGFGTLDQDSLDQTMAYLEVLQSNNNKTIGLISHVPILKERISTQILINKVGQGRSELEVIST